jgi:O-antigen/teichoic acid export membrane protein
MAVTIAASFPLIAAFGVSGAAAASAIGYGCGAVVAWLLFRGLARRSGRRRRLAPES